MSIEYTKEIMRKYLESGKPMDALAEDVVFTDLSTGNEYKTPQGILGMYDYFYQTAFEADADTKKIYYGENHAVVEYLFHGRHIGLFAGVPATMKEVQIPFTVIYENNGEKIVRARIYFLVSVFLQQVGVRADEIEG
jgi:hypothetical protein